MTAEPEMRLVPVEPTEAMLQGGCSKHKPGQPMSDKWDEECPSFVSRRKIWSDMLSAAPAPQEGEREALTRVVSSVAKVGLVPISPDHVRSGLTNIDEIADAILALRRPAAPAPVADDMDAEAVSWIREAAKAVTGGNCAFVDDDLRILQHLAQRATSAGLTDGLAPDVAARAALTAGAEPRDGEKPARWEHLREDGTWIITDDPRYRSAKYQVRALYAHPPAPDARLSVAVEALTKIRDHKEEPGGYPPDDVMRDTAATALRQIEGG